MTTKRPLLRASSVRDCPRKAVYEATGAPARERYDSEERILFRGRRIGRDYGDLLAEKYGETALERERKIVWALGVGHADLYLKQTRTIIEVLSSAFASTQMVDSKLLQLVLYIEHDPEADNGVLVIVNPSDFGEDRIIVSPRSDKYQALVEEMQARLAELTEWDATGKLPDRVCRKPADARSHFCLHADHCFEGWEPPEPPDLDGEAAELAAAWVDAKERERAGSLAAAEAAATRKELEQQLAELAPVGVSQAGPFAVVRTHVARRPTFQWERAELAGVFSPEAYLGYFKAGSEYDTWKIERRTPEFLDEVLAEDWGDVPF